MDHVAYHTICSEGEAQDYFCHRTHIYLGCLRFSTLNFIFFCPVLLVVQARLQIVAKVQERVTGPLLLEEDISEILKHYIAFNSDHYGKFLESIATHFGDRQSDKYYKGLP